MNERPDIEEVAGGLYVNQSRLSDFMSCEVLYELNWEHKGHGMALKSRTLNLDTGTAYHAGAAEYYRSGKNVVKAIEVANATFKEFYDLANPIGEERNEWEENQLLLAIMLSSYHRRYEREPFDVIAPEVEGVARLGDSKHHLVFRTDAIAQQYGSIGLLDHKTKGRTPSALEIAKIHLGVQPSAYIYGTRRTTGLPVSGMWVRYAIKNAKLDPNKMHIEAWTGRGEKEIARFERQAIIICDRILELRRSGNWVHNWNNCTTFGECHMRRFCLHNFDPAVEGLYAPREPDYVTTASQVGLTEGTTQVSKDALED